MPPILGPFPPPEKLYSRVDRAANGSDGDKFRFRKEYEINIPFFTSEQVPKKSQLKNLVPSASGLRINPRAGSSTVVSMADGNSPQTIIPDWWDGMHQLGFTLPNLVKMIWGVKTWRVTVSGSTYSPWNSVSHDEDCNEPGSFFDRGVAIALDALTSPSLELFINYSPSVAVVDSDFPLWYAGFYQVTVPSDTDDWYSSGTNTEGCYHTTVGSYYEYFPNVRAGIMANDARTLFYPSIYGTINNTLPFTFAFDARVAYPRYSTPEANWYKCATLTFADENGQTMCVPSSVSIYTVYPTPTPVTSTNYYGQFKVQIADLWDSSYYDLG